MINRTMAILHPGVAASTRVVDNLAFADHLLCRSIAVAVQRLEIKSDADYGTIPKASFELAARLEDCAASSPDPRIPLRGVPSPRKSIRGGGPAWDGAGFMSGRMRCRGSLCR
ncbi:hypothetical protein [Streptomyces sp. PRh5]|uniref:hypothetical protein n=1 Tax=Streptomyces sp. PRh5 TaxID=1158056 RepID=UPI0004B58F55|nr:hypothetical protein [Streptomyces sp. PRh5]